MAKELSTGWIYGKRRDELIEELTSRRMEVPNTVEEMRKALKNHIVQVRIANNTFEEGDDDGPDEEANSDASSDKADDKGNSRKSKTVGDIIDRVRKWSIRFEGNRDVIDFIDRVEELADAYNIPKDKLPQALPELLKGKAL